MVSIPKNPFTEERRQELQDSAQEFLTEFSKNYLKAFGFCLLESILGGEKDSDAERRLKYRKWDAVQRPELYEGKVYCKSGNGPGTWSKWKAVYIVETQDYKIQVYKSEKDFKGKKKPTAVISPCGYNIVPEVTEKYKRTLREIGPDMGLSEEEMEGLAQLSQYAWAVYHPLRTNYVFQLHESKEPGGCLCLGGGGGVVEPDDLGAEEAKGRPDIISFMERCASKCQLRDTKSIRGKAFERTVKSMVASFDTLSYFKDDGSEAEILTDMLVQHCIMPLQKPILEELATAPGKLKIKLWMKTKALILDGMVNIVKPAWAGMEKAVDELTAKIEPVLRSGSEKFNEAKENFKGKVRDNVLDKVNGEIQKSVSPHLKSIMQIFEEPIDAGFKEQKEILDKGIPEVEKLPGDPTQRNLKLDRIPRQRSTMKAMGKATDKIVKGLSSLKDAADIFDYLQPQEYKQQTEEELLRVMDAAIFTLEQQIDANGAKAELKDQVLQDWEVDCAVTKNLFIKAIMKEIIIGGLKKLLAPAVDPVLDPIDSVIPDEMQDFLSARNLYDEVVDFIVGEPIESMVNGAYPLPK